MGWMADQMVDDALMIEAELFDLYQNDIWLTKDGNKVHIQKMTNSHLKNCINYIEKGHYIPNSELWIDKLKNELNKRK